MAENSLARNGIGGKVGIADHDFVAVTHGAQRVQDVGVQQRIEVFKHCVSFSWAAPLSCRVKRPNFICSASVLLLPRLNRRTESRYSSLARLASGTAILRTRWRRTSRTRGRDPRTCASDCR